MGWNIFRRDVSCGPLNATLTLNEACLVVHSQIDTPLRFYLRNLECYKCDFLPRGRPVYSNAGFVMDTRFGYESYFYDGKNKLCEMTYHLEDFGVYRLNIKEEKCGDLQVVKEPEEFWTNIGLTFGFYLITFMVFWLLRFIYRFCKFNLSSGNISLRELEMDLGSPTHREEREIRMRRQSRITSIDAFRGLAIIIMIFVNYGGGEYPVFEHSYWNGLNIADLVFPWFVWLMGASVVLSLRSSLRTSTSRRKIFWRILKRTILLVTLGLILNSGKRDNGYLRICGVLQRLGVTYFVVASIEILIAKPQRNDQFGPWFYCQDMIDSWMQWILAVGFVAAHCLLTFLLQVPGCPTGYLGPGGLSEHSAYKNCTGGAAGYIDRIVITENHMYHHGTFNKIYKPPVPYDPEGLLGTLTSIFCALLGVHAARIFISFENPYARIRQWLLWGILTGILSGILCNWFANDGSIPINKNLWSLSYVLACSSLAFFILVFFYWFIDFTHIWSGFPFVYPGMNSVTIYVGHSLLKKQLPWRWIPFTDTHLEILIMDVGAAAIWTVVSYILYKYNIFISL